MHVEGAIRKVKVGDREGSTKQMMVILVMFTVPDSLRYHFETGGQMCEGWARLLIRGLASKKETFEELASLSGNLLHRHVLQPTSHLPEY